MIVSIEQKGLEMGEHPDHSGSSPAEDLSLLLASGGHDEQTGWSDSELDRVSGVIRRVSMSADSPHIQSIVKQLQIELTKLKSDMASQHTVLEGVTAERAEVAQRLLEVEGQVQNANSLLQEKLLEAEQQTEARIEAEITAARDCVDRLADHKEILKQRRLVREERLIRMDAEVAVEVANMNARRMARLTGAGAVNRQLLAAADQGIKNTTTPKEHSSGFADYPASIFDDINLTQSKTDFDAKIQIPNSNNEGIYKAPSPSDLPCSHFKLPSQPLVPSKECPFFAPNPVRTPFSRPPKDSTSHSNVDMDKASSSSKSPSCPSAFSAFKPPNSIRVDFSQPISHFLNTLSSSSKIDPSPGLGGTGLSGPGSLPLSLNDDLNNDNADYDDYGGDNDFGECDNDISLHHGDEDNITHNDENTIPVSTNIPGSTDIRLSQDKMNVRKSKNISTESVLTKKQKNEEKNGEDNEQKTENENENKSSVNNRNKINYYGNLKFIPLKVRATKPRPIEAKVCICTFMCVYIFI
jgi:hypothetical protein